MNKQLKVYDMSKVQLTDAQIKAQIIARTQESSKSKSTELFPTEIIPLPSQGLVYPKDNPLSTGEIEVRYMTAKDEDILTNQNYLKQGVALDRLYESIVVGNGKGESVNINDMIMGDRSAIMLAARILGYGPDYSIMVKHPTTGKELETVVDLNALTPKPLDVSLYSNSREFKFTLPISKTDIVIRLLTALEQKAIERDIKAQEKAGIAVRNTTTILKHIVVSVENETDPKYIAEFIDNSLLARDSLMLRSYVSDITPDYDLTITVDIPEEDYLETIPLPVDTTFFWPRS